MRRGRDALAAATASASLIRERPVRLDPTGPRFPAPFPTSPPAMTAARPSDLWQRFQTQRSTIPNLGISLDLSRMNLPDDWFQRHAPAMTRAFDAMDQLEAGAIANPDEARMVGHYWLRAPERAPTPELRRAIEQPLADLRAFAQAVHSGQVAPPSGGRFDTLLIIGIGGSALGPQLVADALGDPATDRMTPFFFDNTDPDGMDRVLRTLGPDRLARTLAVVISKSGGTPETRNGMLVATAAYERAGLKFGPHAVAITGVDSQLDRHARDHGFLARFPMEDWVGGRTSQTSVVGLLPAALQGLDIQGLLEGARLCDQATRLRDPLANPAAALALAWLHATNGKGEKDMVVLPYKDRLLLMSRYLQQLVMESLGKRLDLDGKRVDQGITVYGNKGSTDQHAYVQQLRDGVPNFFAVFIRVLEAIGPQCDPLAESVVDPAVQATSGDYLHGFLLGTRAALFENDRASLTITLPRVDAQRLGGLIALFERAVGFYATLVNINAYHQPGVEAGKKAAAAVLDLQKRLVEALAAHASTQPMTAAELAQALSLPDQVEPIYLLLEHLAANGRAVLVNPEANPGSARFAARG